MFYISTQAVNILIDFENKGHIDIIRLLAEQAAKLKQDQELSPSDMQKGRSLFKKVLGESVVYSKQDGADCTYRLSTEPSVDLSGTSKFEWFDDNEKMIDYV